MRVFIGVVAVLGALVFLGAAFSSRVNHQGDDIQDSVSSSVSDEEEYLREVRAKIPITIGIEDNSILGYGKSACNAKAKGASSEDLISMSVDSGLSYSDSNTMISLAFEILC
jgi:hypothetical protein